MRSGDLSVEVVPLEGGVVREQPDGTVLARPGQVYALRLTNHAPLRAVVAITLDGRPISGGGLVLPAQRSVTLERPMQAHECGRFTVIAEGNETVFGPDGGRSNPDLGLIEIRYRRELPSVRRVLEPIPVPGIPPRPSVWDHQTWIGTEPPAILRGAIPKRGVQDEGVRYRADLMAAPQSTTAGAAGADVGDVRIGAVAPAGPAWDGIIERAAGTGLTGHSAQTFRDVVVGALEAEETILRLRLVIGSPAALEAPRPLPVAVAAPARPEARP